jgi:hypothetical protein
MTFVTNEDNSIDTTATGPIAMSLELPITAYIRGGTILVSEYKQNQVKQFM